jgi:hypothetical protein
MKRTRILVLVVGLIFLAQAAQAGWTANKRLTWTSSYSYLPAIAIDSSYFLHLIWTDDTPGNWEIFYKKSTNGGTDWTTNKRITWSTTGSGQPDIAVDKSNNIQVVYVDHAPGPFQIYHKRSTDTGVHWSAAKRVTWTAGAALLPALAVDSSSVLHMVWQDDVSGNAEIYYKQSNDEGETWTLSKRLTWNSGDSHSPDLAIDSSDNLHLVWSDNSPGGVEIYYKKSTDGGITWTANKRITWMSSVQLGPKIAVDSSDNPHVVWQDALPGSGDIYYRKSEDGGTTWEASKKLSGSGKTFGEISIGVALAGQIYVVWNDSLTGTNELYYKKSTSGGDTWSLGQRITYLLGDSRDPAFVLDSLGEVNLVWSDSYPGNYELYFKKGN